jgi:Holliday junction DNA helicase RuvB
MLSEDEHTIEDVIEPYLLANGYIEKTSRGRIATQKTFDLLLFPNTNNKNLFEE